MPIRRRRRSRQEGRSTDWSLDVNEERKDRTVLSTVPIRESGRAEPREPRRAKRARAKQNQGIVQPREQSREQPSEQPGEQPSEQPSEQPREQQIRNNNKLTKPRSAVRE